MRDEDYSSNDDSSYRQQSTGPATVEDARRQYEQMKNGAGISAFNVQTDHRDGRSHILGFGVSKNIKPILELTIANVLPYIQRHGAELVHNKTLRFLDGKPSANKMAWAAENTFRWGLIGLKPVTDIIYAGKIYSRQRKKLFEEFAPVIDATKANYQNNEVIRAAFDQLHEDMVTDMKMVAADLPTLIPMVLFGLQDQKTLKEKRQSIPDPNADMSAAVRKDAAELAASLRQQRAYVQESRIAINTAREEFVKEQLAMDKSHQHKILGDDASALDEKKLREYFDQHLLEPVQDKLERKERARLEAAHGKQDHASGDKYDSMMMWMIPAASGISQVIKENIHESEKQRKKRVNAWEMIKHLKQEVEQQCANAQDGEECNRNFQSRSADDITVSGMGNKNNTQFGLKDYILEVFQQHERDRLGIHDRSNPLGPALIAQLSPAIDVIADHIADGRLDPYALVNLVGENKVILHQSGGARSFAKADQVQKSIDDLLSVLSTRDTIKAQEFFANFADPALIQNTLKTNLQTMKGMEKAFFVSLFPDDILLQAGMKKKDIVAERKEAHQQVYDIVAAGIINIASKTPEEIKALGLTERQATFVNELSERIREGDMEAVKTAVDGRDKTALDVIRTTGLQEQAKNTGEGQSFWGNRVKEALGIRQKIADMKHAPKKDDEAEEKHVDKVAQKKSETAVDRELERRSGDSPEDRLGV